MRTSTFYKRFYRLEKDEDDWAPYVSVSGGAHATVFKGDGDVIDSAKNEYLRAVFKPEGVYSVPVVGVDENGEEATTMFFQVMAIHHGSHRPKILETDYVDQQLSNLAAPFAVTLQMFDVWRVRSDNFFCMYIDSCPVTRNILDVAPWLTLHSNMRKWEMNVSDVHGCYDMSNPTDATPQIANMDPACPFLCVVQDLRALGWVPFKKQYAHDNPALKEFDSRSQALSRKFYFQSLICLERILPICGNMHSNQPATYYQLALRGEAVIPNQGDKEYRKLLAILDGVDVRDVDPPVLALKDAFDDFDVCEKKDIAPKKKAMRKTVVATEAAIPLPLPAPAPGGDPPKSSSSRSSSPSSSSSSSLSQPPAAPPCEDFDPAEPDEAPRSMVSEWVEVEVVQIKLDKYKPRGKPMYMRFICACPEPEHGRVCERKKSTKTVGALGDLESIAYLIAWAHMGAKSKLASHRARNFKVPFQTVVDCVQRLERSGDANLLLDLLHVYSAD